MCVHCVCMCVCVVYAPAHLSQKKHEYPFTILRKSYFTRDISLRLIICQGSHLLFSQNINDKLWIFYTYYWIVQLVGVDDSYLKIIKDIGK